MRANDLIQFMDKYKLTTREVAEYLGCSVSLIGKCRMDASLANSRRLTDEDWEKLKKWKGPGD